MTLRELDAASRLRRTSRLVVMGAWTALCYLALAAGRHHRALSGTWSRRWNELAVKVWTRGLVTALGMKVNVVGHAVKPFFMVANHLATSISSCSARGLARRSSPSTSWHRGPSWATSPASPGDLREPGPEARRRSRLNESAPRSDAAPAWCSSRKEQQQRRPDLSPGTALLEWAARHRYPVHAVSLRWRRMTRWSAVDDICWWGDAALPHFSQPARDPRGHGHAFVRA